MKRLRLITAITLVLIITVLPMASCNKNDGNNGNKDSITGLKYPEVGLDEDILERTDKADVIYTVKASTKGLGGKAMNADEKLLLQSIQGIVAQRKAELYLGSANDKYLKYAKEKFNLTLDDGSYVYTVDADGNEQKTESTTTWLGDLASIINHYTETGDIKGYVKIKMDSAKFSELKNQSNQGCTFASAYQYIIVTDKKEAELNEKCSGVKLGKDISATQMTQIEAFKECESELGKDVLIMQAAKRVENLREYGISQKAGFYFYNRNDPEADRDYVYSSLNIMANAYGWEQIDETEDGVAIGMTEDPSVDFASERDVNVFAADWCSNLSIWMSMPVGEYKQTDYKKLSTDEEQVHYVTMLYSDGDNIQWTSNGGFADSFYLATKKDKKEMPFGWTLTPSLAEINPGMLSYLYENMTDIEQFVGSVSGYAYSHPARFTDEGLAAFARNTAVMMKKADIDLLAMKGVNERVMDAFSDQEEIRGGFVMYGADDNKGGNIYWANGKPFIHDRYIFWDDKSGDRNPEQIAKRIVQLRDLSTDKTQSNCYTFIQIHCWSYKYADIVKKFYDEVKKESSIKVITPGEMVDLITANVKADEGKYTK